MKPRFYHDCTKCVFLGEIVGADAYYCVGYRHTTYIIRFGNKGLDYVGVRDFSDEAYKSFAQGSEPLLVSPNFAPTQANSNELYFRRLTLIRLLAPEIAYHMENQHGN